MRLEDYIDVQGPLQVRVKGHRIGIEIILGDYLEEGLSAEEIATKPIASSATAVSTCPRTPRDLPGGIVIVAGFLFDENTPHRAIHKLLHMQQEDLR